MRASPEIAHSLLAVDTNQRIVLSPHIRLYAFILAVLNLIPSGLSEHLLRVDPEGYYLSLFLLSHSAAYSIVALTHFTGSSRVILEKAQMFPTTSMSRMLFVISAIIRHPFSAALISSNVFFFIILYRHDVVAAFTAVAMYLLLVVNISVCAGVVFLLFERRGMSAGIALFLLAFVVLAGFAGSFVFRSNVMSQYVPLVNWCVNGILSALRGSMTDVVLHLGLLTVCPPLVMFLGKKWI